MKVQTVNVRWIPARRVLDQAGGSSPWLPLYLIQCDTHGEGENEITTYVHVIKRASCENMRALPLITLSVVEPSGK